ncbi:hypothetical protein [Campylobacter majalis]|uniref:hypothetical protein n=1 Tax=Campylobacter majalis TaxID=2790656 RepID=UPI001E6571B2|nr:hypothetical protein [Campylobacter majalis]
MEFLSLIFFALSLIVVLFKPQKECLAFGSFVIGTLICFVMFFIASWTSLLPFASY